MNILVSQLFLHLSFSSIFRGTYTLIGTTTNLVIAGEADELGKVELQTCPSNRAFFVINAKDVLYYARLMGSFQSSVQFMTLFLSKEKEDSVPSMIAEKEGTSQVLCLTLPIASLF